MKGIIFNLLQAVTEEVHDEQMWDELLQTADLDGAYTALGNYPDEELDALMVALGRRTGRDVDEVLQWLGRQAMPHLADRYPAFFAPPDPVSFVLTLHDVIHSEVTKLYPGARPPTLTFGDVTPRSVTVDYRSHRALSDLGIGFLHGAADVYAHRAEIVRTMRDPDGTHVSLRCRFEPT
ncbi:MAG TPA: heme NO-binding domain-containing protein [Euzebya sp.]|nr:heme NO-binding domain-containing protein [Euzebya sp.]